MLRPMVATTAVTAAVILLAGCGGNDKKSESSSDGDGNSTTSATPSAPAISSFDPPKAFAVAAAYGNPADSTSQSIGPDVGIIGQTVLTAGRDGLLGRNVAGLSSWQVPARSAETTTVSNSSKPMGVTYDGKDAIVIAYAETDKGNGTQKAKGLIVFQWIDPTAGRKLTEVTADLSQTLGAGVGDTPSIETQAYDAETGQVALGISIKDDSDKVGREFTVYADPKTQKSSLVPFVSPAGVLNGTIAGAKAGNQEGAANGTIVLADAATGKITKQFPTGMDYLTVIGSGKNRGYISGHKLTSTKGQYGLPIDNYNNTLYAVDFSTGAVVTTKSGAEPKDEAAYNCWSDQAGATVCTGGGAGSGSGGSEILGFDDSTGKKTWGYTDKSASRVIPTVTAAFHGVVYAQTEAQPVLMDAKTGQDLPSAGPTPTDSSTPTPGDTPSSSGAPSSSDTPGSGETPSDGSGNSSGPDLSLFDGKLRSPEAVSPYGAVYNQAADGNQSRIGSVTIVLKATA